MARSRVRLIALLMASPLAVALSVFLGDGWQTPHLLFSPGREGILELRLWRVALGALVGSSLAVAGAVMQAVLRNPLAEPYVLGISSGAALAVAGCIAAGLARAAGGLGAPVAGFAGAALSLIAVYRLSRVGGRTSPHTLVLAGVAWGALCGSLLMFLVSKSSAEGLHAVVWWFLGDLQVYSEPLVRAAALVNAAAMAGVFLLARPLNALILGDEIASHVGLDAERAKLVLLALGACLAATSVSVGGIIAFAGLVVPHAARALVGPDHRRLLPAAAALGAAFLTVADGVGRTVLFPEEIPVGIFTALAGAPFFLHLLRRRQKEIWI
jgi:iron complex transport system permease protein